jgi:transcriptional regulator with XRE-family HTH domain
MRYDETLGQLLREARVAKGLSREALAHDLKLPLRAIESIESDAWDSLPPGRARPLARQMATRLDVDLDHYPDAFQIVPGSVELSPPDPRQERLERVVMGLLSLASIAVLLWLVVPGPRLGRRPGRLGQAVLHSATLPPPPPPASGPYPVLGELLPEAPVTEAGIHVSLRALDTCEARIQGSDGTQLQHTLRVSEPWRLRVKGPFTLSLDNAGVVAVEVAGHRILHGQSVGASWTGAFDAQGQWQKPEPPPVPSGAPPNPDDESGTP